jgi:hypothetical protein
MQNVALTQLTPSRTSLSVLDVSGEGTIVQPLPLHSSTSVWLYPDDPE